MCSFAMMIGPLPLFSSPRFVMFLLSALFLSYAPSSFLLATPVSRRTPLLPLPSSLPLPYMSDHVLYSTEITTPIYSHILHYQKD
jgi:hypothetical protein